MAHHRYGRHGPKAWKHWRKRHSNTSLLVVPQNLPALVIYITISIDGKERIIPVNTAQPSENLTQKPPVEGSVHRPELASGEKKETHLTILQQKAQIQAVIQAEDDKDAFTIQNDANLHKIAKNKALRCLQIGEVEHYISQHRIDPNAAIKEYINEFVRVYIENTGGTVNDLIYRVR